MLTSTVAFEMISSRYIVGRHCRQVRPSVICRHYFCEVIIIFVSLLIIIMFVYYSGSQNATTEPTNICHAGQH